MKKNILVTGGAGFIGTNLIEALLKNPNNNIHCLDNYFSGSKNNHLKESNILKETPKMLIKFYQNLNMIWFFILENIQELLSHLMI